LDHKARIYVAGHRGLVGSAICRRLEKQGHHHVIVRTHEELDLTRQEAVEAFFRDEHPEYVFLAAARVGGIGANSAYPADFIRDNLAIQGNVIQAAYESGVRKMLFLGSSCIYPRECPQPIKEEYLLTGPLEPTNEPYAVAKIAGIKMCQSFRRQYGFNAISVMPTNLYGPHDNFDLDTSHVLPALIRKFHEAKIQGAEVVEIWGTGSPRREFLHVDDLADACLFLMDHYDESGIINIGTGKDQTIGELAATVARVVGYSGQLRFNTSMPDGTPVKVLDVSRLTDLGWRFTIDLEAGIRSTYQWYLNSEA
jgi:GDP-L-fucose synthase